jgi:hypothetical protein
MRVGRPLESKRSCMLRAARSRLSMFPFRPRTANNTPSSANPVECLDCRRTYKNGPALRTRSQTTGELRCSLGAVVLRTGRWYCHHHPSRNVSYLSPDGRFRMGVPDFSQDPLAGSSDHAGEIQLWARDRNSAQIVAQLIPAGPPAIKTRMGGLKIQSDYPSQTVFAPCAANPPLFHDPIGFALRPDVRDACDR